MAVEEKNRKIDNYEKQGGRALPLTNQMMRIAGHSNPTRDYTIWSTCWELRKPNEDSALWPFVEKKPRKIDNYEKQGGHALPLTNQMMRIAGHSNPTRDYTIWSSVLGDREA